jgi:ATP-binding cassette subfamily B protein
MKKQVYKHLLKTYGDLPLLWIGIALEILRVLIQKVFLVLSMSYVAVDIATNNISAAKSHTILFVVIYIFSAVLGATGELIAIRTTDRRYKILLINYYQKLVGKDMSFYRDHQTGYLTTLFRQHLDGTIALGRLFRGDLVRIAVSLIGPVIVLLLIQWQLGLLVLSMVVVLGVYVMWSSDQAHRYRKPAQEIYRTLTAEVSDEITNAVAFKSAGHESESRSNVTKLSNQEMDNFWQRHKATILLDIPRMVLTGLGIGIGFYIIITTTKNSVESIGLIILLFTYLLQIMHSIADLPDLILRNDEHIAKVYPTLEYVSNAFETIADPIHPKPLHITSGTIEIKNVDFAYKAKGNKKVFDQLNMHIKGGESVGIVGLSGAGKSTLAGLLMRFDDIDSGSITIDGINIREIRQSELRQNISYVPQEALLFHRSIKENIAYFKKDATDEEITKAAQIARAHEFIIELSDGYNTLVGERGIKLSGGQKQRIVIARSILKNAPIIIFDEATSALDSESEQLIQNALPQIMEKRTAIVIAHRLSTVARLDRIIVMHEGKIVEQGTHDKLLAEKGRYYSFWQKQNI